MIKNLHQLSSTVTGSEAVSLDKRMFNAILFTAAMIALSMELSNLALESSMQGQVMAITAFLLFISLYAVCRVKGQNTLVSWIFILASCAIVLVEGMFISGYYGYKSHLFLAITCIYCIHFSGKQLVSGLALIFLSLTSLLVFEIIEPDFTREVIPTNQSILDNFFMTAFLGAGLSLLIWLIMREYRSSKYTIELLNADLKSANKELIDRNRELEDALKEVKTLSGLLPICMHCKSIRDDEGYWNRIESYIQTHSSAKFSHGICERCLSEYYPDMSGELLAEQKNEEEGNSD